MNQSDFIELIFALIKMYIFLGLYFQKNLFSIEKV